MTGSLKGLFKQEVFDEFILEFKRQLNLEWADIPNLEATEPAMRALVWTARRDGLKRALEVLGEMKRESEFESPLQKALEDNKEFISEIRN